MLQITIPKGELWDEKNERFVYTKEQTLQLEHSLVSLSKWESKWCKPFISREPRTPEETIDYIRCMTLTQNVDPNCYLFLSMDQIKKINEYIESPMTATTFSKNPYEKPNREQITAELLYYSMIALNIPFECQKWHLNRLLTLIKVCNIKNTPPKKMNKSQILKNNASLNAARKQKFNTTG